jgi:glycosyltransferase involved in cell wall biosynthesis
MRIALAMEYPLLQQGGTEVLVLELVRRLSAAHEIVLVTGDKNRADLPADVSKSIFAHIPWMAQDGSKASAQALAHALADHKVELAHFHFGGTYEWSANRIWRCPVFYAAREVPCFSTNHLVVEWLNCGVHPRRSMVYKYTAQAFAWINRCLLYSRLRCEVCVSRHDRDRLARMFPLFGKKLIQRYHSLLKGIAGDELNLEREPIVLCVGTIGGRKAQHFLAEAFASIAKRHPKWKLILAGRTGLAEDLDRIKEIIRGNKMEGRIQIPGRLSDEATLKLLRTASLFAMPSLQEGLGLSLQEALFEGCVAVGTRVGGIPELIDDGVNGTLVPSGDVPALADALEKFMADPDLLEKRRRETRASIVRKGMTSEAMVESYLDIYRTILQGKTPA